MKQFILAFAVFFSFQLHAQVRIAVKGGFNYSTAKASYGGIKQSHEFVPGGNLGLQIIREFDGPLYFSPYITYSSRGFIVTIKDTISKNIIHYIDIAAVLSFHIPAGANSLVLAAGPTLGVAFMGTEKRTVEGITTSSKMKFSIDGNYSYFDPGLHTSIGYHFKKIFIEAAYQLGLSNINNNGEFDRRDLRNRTFSLNLGYYLR